MPMGKPQDVARSMLESEQEGSGLLRELSEEFAIKYEKGG
jgi:hypothetical protein